MKEDAKKKKDMEQPGYGVAIKPGQHIEWLRPKAGQPDTHNMNRQKNKDTDPRNSM
jgi:hypothetical protein